MSNDKMREALASLKFLWSMATEALDDNTAVDSAYEEIKAALTQQPDACPCNKPEDKSSKKYHYFASYRAGKETGNVFFNRSSLLDSKESLRELEDKLEENYDIENVIIINFQLLRVEDDE